jgi:saccharopine dehydrogenase (NADP+, L-glutamate forming)
VELKVENNSEIVWHKQYILDTLGNGQGSAMAQLVSNSVALAVEAILANDIPPGVSAAPHEPELVERWLNRIKELSDHFVLLDHLI